MRDKDKVLGTEEWFGPMLPRFDRLRINVLLAFLVIAGFATLVGASGLIDPRWGSPGTAVGGAMLLTLAAALGILFRGHMRRTVSPW